MQRTASQACYDLIRQHEDEEGYLAGRCTRLKAYLCPAGVWTIAWGHTRGVVPGMTCTPGQAEEWLRADVALVERDLEHLVQFPLSQGQWDALVSLCFNLHGGAPALPHRAPKLWAALEAGDRRAAAHEFLDMDHSNGVRLAGLTRRRIAEAALFLS